MKTMLDRLGRTIDYLRLSVTQRCNLNCSYCGAVSGVPAYEMTPGEMLRCVRVFAALGVTKLRLTGGEPLVRADLAEITALLSPVIPDINATTNGTLLTPSAARELKAAGLKRINISLDSLKPERYAAITGGGNLADALNGIENAMVSSLTPLHINAVLMRGVNDDEAGDFIRLAKEYPLTVRFIELMLLSNAENAGKTVPGHEIRERYPDLAPVGGRATGSPSVNYSAPGFQGAVGFISPVTEKFCAACNRVRLLSDGILKPCLGCAGETDLKPFFGDEEKLASAIRAAVYGKPTGHHFERGCAEGRPMRGIGG